MTIKGVDVGSFQGEPAAWRGVAGDIQWAALKVTELEANGTRYVNPDAGDDWAWLRVNGKGRVAYLFGHPSVPVAATVDFFVTELDKIGLDDGDGVALDHETSDGLPASKVAAWAADVLAELAKRLDRKPILYTYRAFASEGNCAGLSKYPLWISDPDHAAGKPEVPSPWKSWAIHQYDITGAIDRDAASYKDVAAMRAAIGKTPPPPSTGEDKPMKFISQLALDGPITVPVGNAIAPLKWKPASEKASLLVKGSASEVETGALVALSIVQVRMSVGTQVRFVVTATGADGKQEGQLARQYDYNGGWVDFVMPVDGVEGWKYEIGVLNLSTVPVSLTQGTWQLIA